MHEQSKRLLTFLLVEDDDSHARIVEWNLKKERITNALARVKDGEEALAYLRRQGEYRDAVRPDVVLLDLKLPKLDGHEVLAEIKKDEELADIPVVILTTSAAEADVKQAYKHHANSYLVKPIDMECFRNMVQELSLYWGIWNEPPRVKD